MEPSDETFDYDYDDQSLNILLSLLICRLDISAKRHPVALFLDSMRITEKQNLLVASKSYIGVRLSDESRNRARELLAKWLLMDCRVYNRDAIMKYARRRHSLLIKISNRRNRGKTKEIKMQIPDYISKEEVQRVCRELGLQDWTELTTPEISIDEVKVIQAEVGGEAMGISAEAFQQGLEVELEHGLKFQDANVTNNHPILTGKIVLAHLKEMLDYYLRLEVAELEGDMLKAVQAGNAEKMMDKYQKVLAAKAELLTFENDAVAIKG